MLLCVRERAISDSHNHSSLQRQFSHGHSQKFEDGGSGSGTRVSHFLPTSRRIVQFSNGKVCTLSMFPCLFVESLIFKIESYWFTSLYVGCYDCILTLHFVLSCLCVWSPELMEIWAFKQEESTLWQFSTLWWVFLWFSWVLIGPQILAPYESNKLLTNDNS